MGLVVVVGVSVVVEVVDVVSGVVDVVVDEVVEISEVGSAAVDVGVVVSGEVTVAADAHPTTSRAKPIVRSRALTKLQQILGQLR